MLIGLGAKAKIGKDYAAIKLAEYFNSDTFTVKRVAFADALKQDVADMVARHGLDYKTLEADPVMKEKLRPLLVEYGMTMRRFDEDIWINRAFANIDHAAYLTVITDVRFPNEVKRLKELGGRYIHIISDVPPANETEAHFDPIMEELADYLVLNRFDEHFIQDLSYIINDYQCAS